MTASVNPERASFVGPRVFTAIGLGIFIPERIRAHTSTAPADGFFPEWALCLIILDAVAAPASGTCVAKEMPITRVKIRSNNRIIVTPDS
ncbi:hypothetical protein [Methylomicrobium lacus]|uniref:hypothetical protein n=1 Tax=Methylomicrobium lacus TaxID=136992 RepID=UPI0013780E9D|nr:hypothetical protein [Methylomicrobium lacus]